jgi:hypothetical protein
VVKFLNQSHRWLDAIVLDVGCGKELPLAKLLYVNKMTPRLYVGVDSNKFDIPEMLSGKKIPITVWSESNFCALDPQDVSTEDLSLPNVAVCFEVLEHNTPTGCRKLLERLLDLTSEDCHYFISTPCYNGSAAENHINELTFQALGGLFEDLGFGISAVYGTFASISDYAEGLSNVVIGNRSTDLRDVFGALRNYYDTNVLAVIFAPLFPENSRNCLWHLVKKQGDAAKQERLFSALAQAPVPWTSHPDWRKLNER